jgi:hypothetical protein
MIFKIVNNRKKIWLQKSFFFNLSFPFSLIVLTLFVLPLYTPWIFNKDVLALKEWFPKPYNFVNHHINRILDENINSFINILLAEEPTESFSIPTEKIWIENGGLEKMNHELLLFNLAKINKKPRVKGYFKSFKTKPLKARISIRGTRATHQMIWKPSLKIRLKNKKLFKGYRERILIAPEDVIGIRNWISSELGSKWNVLNNLESFTNLYINSKNFGLYNVVSPFNESLLIQFGKLPGPIFNFNIYNKQLFKIRKTKWFDPKAWKLTEKKYRTLPNAKLEMIKVQKISYIISSWEKFQENSIPEFLKVLNHYISQEQFAKYLAILSHGGEKHYLDNHNAIFWLDPSSGQINPIINDQNGYGLTDPNKWITNPIIKNEGAFVQAWFKNPLNQAIYVEKLNELINTIGNKKNIERMIRDQWDKLKPVTKTETFLSYSCWPARCFFPMNKLDEEVDKLISDINLRLTWIRKELNRDQIFLIKKNKENFEVLVLGYSGVKVNRKDNNEFNLSTLKSPTNYNDHLINLTSIKNENLLPTKSILESVDQVISFNNSYSFYVLNGNPRDYVFKHRLSNKEVKIISSKPKIDINKFKKLTGVNHLNFVENNMTPVSLGPGKINFIESKIFNSGQPVTIKPGTEIYLGEKVQILIKGPLTIEGTVKNPVIIKPINPKQPFGVLALLGKKTKNSKINYLNIEGGSVGAYYNLKFSGMLSVHDCPDIEIRNSVFGKNFIGDDAVHIINSKAIITNSIFVDSKYDALDLDLVEGKFLNNQFINPGNDGLDLSMGNTTIEHSRFIGCKDKCISVGEGAKTNITSSYFQGCNNAIAVKDKSYAILKDSIIENCNIGWNSYRKKWRWELGGRGEIINTKFINSKSADLAGDKLSSVTYQGKAPALPKIKGKLKVEFKPNIGS